MLASENDTSLIHHFLEKNAQVLPDKHAMVHGDERSTYELLNREANRLATWFLDIGLVPGDRVILLMENCRNYLVGYYACLKAGGVAVPLNPELKPESLAALFSSIEPRVVISSTKCERILKLLDFSSIPRCRLLIARPRLKWTETTLTVNSFEEITASGDVSNLNVPLEASCLASIIFTSGSTGKPKGVMLSHLNIVSNTRSIVKYLELTSADIQMAVLPFFYVMGKSLLNTHIAVGGTIIINNTFAYPASVIQQMIDENVTGFSGVPSTYAYLLHRSPLRSVREKLPTLRYCSQAGGHMARHTKEELLRVLPEHTKLYVMYGATEAAARLAYVEPHRLQEKIDSIGIPIPNITLKVLDGNGMELPHGETGELVANGSNIMPGYWKDPEATANALSRNGYHTGDMGYRDDEGYFFVVGRKDNQLKVGGHRVNPQEIEDAIMATGLVIECSVLGLPDPLAGHRLVAVAVATGEEVIEQDILFKSSKILPRYKLPGEIRLVRMLPKNSSGKIDRGACAEIFALNNSSREKEQA